MRVCLGVRSYGPNVGRLCYAVDENGSIDVNRDIDKLRGLTKQIVKPDLCYIHCSNATYDPLDYPKWLVKFVEEGWLLGVFKEVEIQTSGIFFAGDLLSYKYVNYLIDINVYHDTEYYPAVLSTLAGRGSVRNDCAKFRFTVRDMPSMLRVFEIVADSDIPSSMVIINTSSTDELTRLAIMSRAVISGFTFDFLNAESSYVEL